MNIKKYICECLSVSLAASMLSFRVFAENNPITVNITDLDLGVVEVTGQVEKVGYTVNLLVLKKSENSDAVEIQYQQDTVSDENGEFEFKFTVHSKQEFDEGWYKVYVGGDGFDGVENKEFYFASPSSKKNAIEIINKAANEDSAQFAEIYKGYSDMFDLNHSAIDGVNENKMFKALMGYVKKNNYAETDFAGVKKSFRIYNILGAYSEGLEAVKSEGKLAMLSELGIDTAEEDAVYDIYNELASKAVDKLVNGMKGKEYADIEAFEKVLKEQIVIAAILNPKENGTGHIREILSDDVCRVLGIDISDYKNSKYKTEIEAELLKSAITDAKNLESAIKSITASVQEKHSTGGSGSGSGGGASFGGGSSTVMPIQNAGGDYIKEEENIRKNPFSDISVAHWAYPAVEQLYARGIINGISADNFGPDAYVTREQLAKIVCTILGEEAVFGDDGFSDVEASRWSAGYINACKNKGYVTGYPDNTFIPDGYVTRQDIAVILSRVINKKAENTLELQFSDTENISDYAIDAVKYFVEKGIIKGYSDNSFKPKKNCTRAEAASIVYAVLKEMEGGK